MNERALVLWDGQCAFCRRAVEWAQRRDTGNTLQVLPYQQAPSPPMTPELKAACARAVHVLTPDGQMLKAGRACLYVLGEIGFRGLARLLSLPPLIWLVECGYWLVARNRALASKVLFRRRRANG